MDISDYRRGDLRSTKLIVFKAGLFLFLAGGACAGLLIQAPSLETGVLLLSAIWSSCRFYYFLFYVIEKHVDPRLKYRGIVDLLCQLRRRP